MQENFLAQKFWSAFLKSKMDKEMARTAEIEQAFQRIRAQTGFSDIQQIVQKFFTRETIYSQLLQAVSDNEEKLDQLRREHEQVTEKLNELQMQDSDQTDHIEIECGSRSANPEIHQLHVKIQSAQKLYDKTIEVAKKVELTNTNVRDWLNRIIKKIDQQFNEQIGQYNEDDKTMSFRFEKVMQAVIKQLDQIQNENAEEDGDRGFITQKDFLNEFATDEFQVKNIRVEATAGNQRGGDDETKT